MSATLRTAVTLVLAGVLLGTTPSLGRESTGDRSPEHIARLVRQLGSQRYRERESAFRELDLIGEAALDSLRQAIRAADAEVVRRANELLERIERRAAAARLLVATPVTLNFQNLPLKSAVDELARRTGLPIELAKDVARPGERRVTLELTQVPVWKAVDELCRAAGLTDREPPAAGADATAGQVQAAQQRARVQMMVINGQMMIHDGSGPARIELTDAAGPGPTDVSGAARVKALPVGDVMPTGEMLPGNDPAVGLRVFLEPKLTPVGAPAVTVDKATDDQGRPVPIRPFLVAAHRTPFGPGAAFGNGLIIPTDPVNRFGRGVALQYTRAEPPARFLAELTGTLTVPVRAFDTLAAIDDPARSTGRSGRTADATVTLTEYARDADGVVRVRAELTLAPDVTLTNPTAATTFNNFNNNRRALILGLPPEPANDASGLTLTDHLGRPYRAEDETATALRNSADGLVLRVAATFRPKSADARPMKLELRGNRPVGLQIPFQLRDVPLP